MHHVGIKNEIEDGQRDSGGELRHTHVRESKQADLPLPGLPVGCEVLET